MFGHNPDITAKNAKGIFHIIDIKIKNYKKEEDYLERLKAFGKYAKLHKDIIETFGRFPHRNKVLNRTSTKKEKEYLKSNYYDFFNI